MKFPNYHSTLEAITNSIGLYQAKIGSDEPLISVFTAIKRVIWFKVWTKGFLQSLKPLLCKVLLENICLTSIYVIVYSFVKETSTISIFVEITLLPSIYCIGFTGSVRKLQNYKKRTLLNCEIVFPPSIIEPFRLFTNKDFSEVQS